MCSFYNTALTAAINCNCLFLCTSEAGKVRSPWIASAPTIDVFWSVTSKSSKVSALDLKTSTNKAFWRRGLRAMTSLWVEQAKEVTNDGGREKKVEQREINGKIKDNPNKSLFDSLFANSIIQTVSNLQAFDRQSSIDSHGWY